MAIMFYIKLLKLPKIFEKLEHVKNRGSLTSPKGFDKLLPHYVIGSKSAQKKKEPILSR
jgi:hypothetical protein